MVLPLYKGAQGTAGCRNDSNLGLWFDKFCHTWQKKNNGWWEIGAPQKVEWLNSFTSIRSVGDRDLLQEYCYRQAALVRACRGELRVYRTAARFMAGIGRENPVENGLTWHPTLGVPYLPGSSLKGIIRDLAETWVEADRETIDRIFGPERGQDDNRDTGEEEGAVGSIIFFDALPLEPVNLEIDIMTPHYGPYYQDNKVPADWYSPVPIPFLTVAANQLFLFCAAPRYLDNRSLADLELVLEWLDLTLTYTGAGAKTATGYGRFTRGNNEKRAEEELLTAAGTDSNNGSGSVSNVCGQESAGNEINEREQEKEKGENTPGSAAGLNNSSAGITAAGSTGEVTVSTGRKPVTGVPGKETAAGDRDIKTLIRRQMEEDGYSNQNKDIFFQNISNK